MALNILYCADVPLSNYSLTHSPLVECTSPLLGPKNNGPARPTAYSARPGPARPVYSKQFSGPARFRRANSPQLSPPKVTKLCAMCIKSFCFWYTEWN